jgi:serine/threonine protein kinase
MFLAEDKKHIGEGYFGIVDEVYEIAVGQLRAVKWASENPEANESINQEIVTLKNIHKLAETKNCILEGIQDLPLATFSLNEFNAFLSPKYGKELQKWSKKTHSNEERIAICKSIIRVFCEKCKLGYWHGDLKPENILMSGNGVVIIDWAGSIPFHEAVLKLKTPTLSSYYTHLLEFRNRELIIEQYDSLGLTDTLKLEFLKVAYSIELFSLSIALFITLVPVNPFYHIIDEDSEAHFPLTRYGIKEESMDLLLKRNYSDEVVKTITKMLAPLPQDRYNTPEAIRIWKNIK